MRPKKFSLLMLGACLLLGAIIIGAVVGGNALLQSKSSELADTRAKNAVAEQQQNSLARGKADIEKYQELDEIARSIVPQDKDQARTVREINQIAAQSGIALKGISFPSSNLGQSSSGPAATGSETTADSKEKRSGLTQLKSISGINGVYSLEIVISPVEGRPVPYYTFLNFLERLETNRRTAHVSKITITPVDGGVTFSLTLNAYVKP